MTQTAPDPTSDTKETESLKPGPSPRTGRSRLASVLGPGLITGASDDDPSGIATYSQVGAQYGYAASWTLLFSYPLMAAVQIVSARLGRTTGRGIAGNLRKFCPSWLVGMVIVPLLVANAINIGADIGAMADAIKLLVGGPGLIYVAAIGVLCVLAEMYVGYRQYARLLKWTSLSLFAYVATAVVVELDWSALGAGLLMPTLHIDADYITAIVAIFGTTISPYLLFWQASQEVEELKADARREPLKDHPEQAPDAQMRINLDTFVGMAFSNVIALAIMVTSAATLHLHHVTAIESSAQAASALEPVAGKFASIVFCLGIVGTGLLAVPVLAGSAAYGLGEALKWPTSLARKPRRAKAFYGAIAAATMIGAGLNLTSISPMKALYWSAVVNGVVAVPVMALMLVMASHRTLMGEETIGAGLRIVGWLAAAVMTLCVVGMFAQMALS